MGGTIFCPINCASANSNKKFICMAFINGNRQYDFDLLEESCTTGIIMLQDFAWLQLQLIKYIDR